MARKSSTASSGVLRILDRQWLRLTEIGMTILSGWWAAAFCAPRRLGASTDTVSPSMATA